MAQAALVLLDMFRRFGIVARPPVPLDAGINLFVNLLARTNHRLVVVLVHVRGGILAFDTASTAVIPHRIEERNLLAIRVQSGMTHRVVVRRRHIAVANDIRGNRRNPERGIDPDKGSDHIAFAQIQFAHTRKDGRRPQPEP